MKTLFSDEAFQRIASSVGMKIMADYTMFPVDSSNLEEIGYDEEEMTLYVRFSAKGSSPSTLYAYYNVEPEIWQAFMESESKGKFVWSHLRDRYQYARLE